MGKREHIYELIAENIRKERIRLGITQAELAAVSYTHLDVYKRQCVYCAGILTGWDMTRILPYMMLTTRRL